MNTNIKYKASVFSFLFSDPDVLRELYCALEGIALPAGVPVTINTLNDVLFMNRVNDISFEIGGKLVILIEHQSTINPNMALRLLIYITHIYERIVQGRNIYSSKKITIPQPEFFVLYNGTDPYPDESVLKLSDLFESLQPLGLPEKENPALELSVKVININHGKNEEIARKCQTLAQYSAFVAKVREYESERFSREEAIRKAVIYCCNHDILKEFLEKNASEVLSMLITEWNWDDAKEVWQEEAHDEGRAEGMVKGRAEGMAQGRNEGMAEGRSEKALEIARKMKHAGRPLAEIEALTGLSSETVEQIG
jgi:hypothetical protein